MRQIIANRERWLPKLFGATATIKKTIKMKNFQSLIIAGFTLIVIIGVVVMSNLQTSKEISGLDDRICELEESNKMKDSVISQMSLHVEAFRNVTAIFINDHSRVPEYHFIENQVTMNDNYVDFTGQKVVFDDNAEEVIISGDNTTLDENNCLTIQTNVNWSVEFYDRNNKNLIPYRWDRYGISIKDGKICGLNGFGAAGFVIRFSK